MRSPEIQFLRKANLIVTQGAKGLDLSELKFSFGIRSADVQTPNNAAIRVYNLSESTVKQVKGEFSSVVLQAGYDSNVGIIFQGTIKQFRTGRVNAKDTFLDILAADGDIWYTQAVISRTLDKGSTPGDLMTEAANAGGKIKLVDLPSIANVQALARGRAAFGMARDLMTRASETIGATWSIENGQVRVTELTKYVPGEAVVINSLTGMIGIPEQMDDGVHVRTLLNPKLRVGASIKLNNADITQLDIKSIVPFNVRRGIQLAAPIANGADGLYRVLVLDHSGDTRGNEWYSDIVCLAIDPSTGQVKPYG